ncbi:Acetyltransferase (GNAT) family protein [Micromonospora rhizosphaerae]|uniref:Acetyltransferase (GNAT) family protein n=1 Tax=Micromonospora rhizosphaerae TaxID=568872 RepID=A0A1C6SMJ2_9ACTN|nr:GNAT family N-acetyltransferase [Micromonospora rhizosphaerae]SCL30562.1 Acetyltransferase (GNAT) family protein [Micromonospora rhizosphaerae]
MTVRVRRAVAADADAAGAVFLACWHRSYADLLPPRVRARYDEASAAALWRRVLAAAPDGVLVAEVTGQGVRAVTRFGVDPDDARRGHVFSLYVHPDAQGLGLGRTLLRAAAEELRAADHATATLWVFAANHAARAFYAAQGWTPDGGTRVEEAYGEPEVRLRRNLSEGDDSTRRRP